MRKIFLAGLVVFLLSGCAAWHGFTHHMLSSSAAAVAPLAPYSGPKARIAVGEFEVKAAKVTSEASAGLREMLITALTNSNRFSVVDSQAQAPKAADLIIAAAITEFEPEASGGREGLGGGGGVSSGMMGGLWGASPNKAHMALEIRISDAVSSKVIIAAKVQGQASNVTGSLISGFSGTWGLSKGLSAYANTPMERAIRICLIEAVRDAAGATPADYYKY